MEDQLSNEQEALLNENILNAIAFKVEATLKLKNNSPIRKKELKEKLENIYSLIAEQNWINTKKLN